ncbi:MAG: hypothetical protein KGS45_05270 [Planctomycetes bacterium]|nr:hypothetical protein [Planctomycetota bacterium]
MTMSIVMTSTTAQRMTFAQRCVLALACMLCVVLSGGCATQTTQTDAFDAPAVTRDGPAPTYAAFAAAHNARVKGLDRLWARAELSLTYTDDEGEVQREEAEANLQYILPRKFSLLISKVGEFYFGFGSNDQKYWWIDVKNSPRTAIVGEHAKATQDKVHRFGLAVLPLELIDALGIAPVRATNAEIKTAWSARGAWMVFREPLAGGLTREWWIETPTMWPGRIRLFDKTGQELIDARFDQFNVVEGSGPPNALSRHPAKIEVRLPAKATTLKLNLNDMQNRGAKAGNAPYELDRLLKAYRIERNIDVDQPLAKPATAQPTGGATR